MINPHFIFVTSAREDGNMDYRFGASDEVEDNRRRFLGRHDLLDREIAYMEVTHEDMILPATPGVVRAEALHTRVGGLALGLLTADCLPVAFADPRSGAIALAHCGWRPIDRGLVGNVIAVLTDEYGARPEDLIVSIGPGIGPHSYVFDEVTQSDPRWRPHVTYEGDSVHIDLAGRVCADALTEGVMHRNITQCDIDTGASPHYFSHYRSVRTGDPEGRMLTILTPM